jgi:hypothetical protein
MANYDNDDKKADDSDKECITASRHSVKCQAWLSIDHFMRLLEEVCPNHVYLIKLRLKDCGMMKNFMTLGSLTQDSELEEE